MRGQEPNVGEQLCDWIRGGKMKVVDLTQTLEAARYLFELHAAGRDRYRHGQRRLRSVNGFSGPSPYDAGWDLSPGELG
jgi:hypothetical protein